MVTNFYQYIKVIERNGPVGIPVVRWLVLTYIQVECFDANESAEINKEKRRGE